MVPANPASIDPDTLHQLTDQLSHWAESLISRGRTPLRKVETFPSLLTAIGELRPPLLFWINRDSCMAGGVVLFPGENDTAAMEMGHYCAQALGLRYFITWTRNEVSFWDDESPPRLRKQLPLTKGAKANARDFQEVLQLLLEEIKLLAVLAAVPPPELSACYLANMWRTTLLAAEPLLNEHYRIARSEERLTKGDVPGQLAIGKGFLTFVRLLALSHYDLLPTEIQPHLLEEEIRRVLPILPPGLRQSLAMSDTELALPEPVAVRYHLLFRRLTQLRPASDLQRCCQALDLLLEQEHRRLGGYAPPCPVPATAATLLLNPDRAYKTVAPALEFASAPLLAGLALQRNLCGHPAIDQTVSLWQAPEGFVPSHISGTLVDQRLPSPERRNHFLALLRRSWPNRRFRLPVATPTWTWHLLHLLGLAAAGATIELRLPSGWLASNYGLTVLELIQKQFTLEQLSAETDEEIILRIKKSIDDDCMTFMTHGDSTRSVEWRWLNSRHPALLSLALHLPDPLLSLLQNGSLCLPEEQTWPEHHTEAIFAFTRSTLGQAFWQLLGDGRPLPRRTLLQKEVLRTGLPLPPSKVLDQLQRTMDGETSETTRQRAYERELALWLGSDLSSLAAGPWAEGYETIAARAVNTDPKELTETITQEVFVDGIPVFPDHYLYDYYRPELRDYTFTPPLNRGSEFFGRVELIDKQQRRLEVEGLDAARALLLCAAAGKTSIGLPVEGQIISAIVQRYLTDLQNLHQALLRCCHRHCADPQKAETLTKTIWADQPLPSWDCILELSRL
ncbi:hypothetical protein A7E78_07005 [Syntrophotalea acetylenivorans]|uniref:Uncharacterized protein n=1 Tax=Syntrophotalea acetylenivorans TaxID=1842532 RepID=A0A1L3GNU1_9BACT|nr:hypothetical protein [Syntrophotalea acetylenivorans]APG27607.1 hypothetical protein A7E78_07005 [Syntrophotalea acetylenivorans]